MVQVSHRRSSLLLLHLGRKLLCIGLCMFFISLWVMGVGMSSKGTAQIPKIVSENLSVETRVRAALWSYFAGDALASPTHWYYGGFPQIQRDYGKIIDYTKPVYHLSGSILNKSNINGGGRGTERGNSKSIIGDVINHGKKELWSPREQIHYHATLQAGENTLEVSLARVLMNSIVANQGNFNADHFRQAYIDFMMKPGSHNDTYASTCHRMFFANLVFGKLDPKECPDNDSHNVETIDGLVLPTIVAIAAAAKGKSLKVVEEEAAQCAGVTRRSPQLERASAAWARLIHTSLRQNDISETLQEVATRMGFRRPKGNKPDEITACYLGSSMPALLDSVAKYSGSSPWDALLANANTGGENVHRGSCLGAVLGANVGMDHLNPRLVNGLCDHEKLATEIDSFVKSILSERPP